MERKRVALIVDHFCLDITGGIHTYQGGLVKELANISKKDLDITLVGFNFSKLVNRYPFLSRYQLIDIPLRRMPLYFDFRHFVIVPLVLRKHGFDAVVELTQSIPFMFKRYKLVGMVTDITPLTLPRLFKHPTSSYLRHSTFFRIALRKCDKVIAISESTKRDLIEYFKVNEAKVIHVPLGFDKRPYKKVDIESRYNLGGRFILSVGTVQPRKNYSTLIRAFDQLVSEESYENLTLVIVGNPGWKCDETLAAHNDAKYKDKIFFLEHIDDQELMNFYEKCLFFVYPSLYEGFGLPILEAMAFGKAVVISNSSAMAEFEVDNNFKIRPMDIEELKEKMSILIEDAATRIEQGKHNKDVAQSYSWSNTASMFLEVISDLF